MSIYPRIIRPETHDVEYELADENVLGSGKSVVYRGKFKKVEDIAMKAIHVRKSLIKVSVGLPPSFNRCSC
jgi:hypothetical protein